MTEFETVDDTCVRIAAFPMRVELGKLREFARATGCPDGPVFDTDDPVILPTFLTTMVFWRPADAPLPHQHLGFDEHRILHGEEEYRFSDVAVRAGDTLDVEVYVPPATSKQGKRGGTMRFGVAITNFRDPGGALVAQSRTTIIETGSTP